MRQYIWGITEKIDQAVQVLTDLENITAEGKYYTENPKLVFLCIYVLE